MGFFTLGHAADMAIAFAPLERMYQLRGFSVGHYNLDNALHKSSKDAPGSVYNNIGHSLKVSLSRLAEFPVELAKDVGRIFGEQGTSVGEKLTKFAKESLFSTDKATMGIIGGLASITGATLNVLGLETAGKISRDFIGALAVDAERFNPQNLKEGKLFYWLAGALFSGGTLSDMAKNTRMQIVFDSLAKMAATEMNRRGELDKDVHNEAIPIPGEDPLGLMQATGEAVAEMLVASAASKPDSGAKLESKEALQAASPQPLLEPIAPALKQAVKENPLKKEVSAKRRSYVDQLESIYDTPDVTFGREVKSNRVKVRSSVGEQHTYNDATEEKPKSAPNREKDFWDR